MSTASVLVVGSIAEQHPSGTRRRAGKLFTPKPSAHFCTPAEAKLIEEDVAIKKHRRLSRGWFMGVGMEFTEGNEKRFSQKDPTPEELGKASGSVKTGDSGDGQISRSKAATRVKKAKPSKGAKKGVKAKVTKPVKKGKVPEKLTMLMSQKDCVAALKAKGLVEGKEFNPEASRKDLVNLYNSL